MPNPEYTNALVERGLGPEDSGGSPGYARLAGSLRPATLANVERKLPPGYFPEEKMQYIHLKSSEALSSQIFKLLMIQPVCRELQEEVESDLIHGFPHVRAVEIIKKHIDGADRRLRNDDLYMYFAPCSFLGMRLHDLVEAHTQQKTGHETATALFAWGFLSKVKTPAPAADWEKLYWGTAFLCNHHSYPENMPASAKLLENGLLDPVFILQEVKALAQQNGKDIYAFFPPFELIRDKIDALEQDAARPAGARMIRPPSFTLEELEGLRKQVLMFVAADKLDSIYPSDYSTNRTLIASPSLPLWIDYPSGRFATPADEFADRRQLGGAG